MIVPNLHSNLVLFKLWVLFLCPHSIRSFTFQSGSIQIIAISLYTYSFKAFTFQSGSIQIMLAVSRPSMYSIFTFQSGSIQMQNYPYNYSCNDSLHSNLVLFKLTRTVSIKQAPSLYIPIWFYSNLVIGWVNKTSPALHSNLVLFKLHAM